MGTNKKQSNKPPIVSIDCSRVKSFLRNLGQHCSLSEPTLHLPWEPKSTTRSTLRDLLANSSPATSSLSITHLRNRRLALLSYIQRAQQLESEINQLGEWLEGEQQLRDLLIPRTTSPCHPHLSSLIMVDHDLSVDPGKGWDTHMVQEAELQTEKAQNFLSFDTVRLENGNYISKMQTRTLQRKLHVQFSEPALASTEAGSTTLEILHNMASLGPKRLFSCLHQLIPLVDIRSDTSNEMVGSPVRRGTTNGFLEDILVYAMNRMEDLVVEGLRIQIGILGDAKMSKIKPRRSSKNQINVVAQLQLRDPYNEYEAVGKVMIVLINAYMSTETEFWISSIVVAGVIATEDKRNEQLEDALVRKGRSPHFQLWSTGKRLQHQCRTQLLRYQDIACGDE